MQKQTPRRRRHGKLCRKVSAHRSDKYTTLLISFVSWSVYQSLALIATFFCGVQAQIITYTLADGDKQSRAYLRFNSSLLSSLILSMFGAVAGKFVILCIPQGAYVVCTSLLGSDDVYDMVQVCARPPACWSFS